MYANDRETGSISEIDLLHTLMTKLDFSNYF